MSGSREEYNRYEHVTVGFGGEFPTLNECLKQIRIHKHRYYGSTNFVVVLLDNYVMEEQVICDGEDMSYVMITSQAPEVVIRRSSLQDTGIPYIDYGSRPAFLGINNGDLPVIDCLFRMDTTGVGDEEKHHGVMAAWGGRVVICRGAGVLDATGRGLYLVNGTAYARNTNWSGAGKRGIRAGNGSRCNARGSIVTGCGEANIYVSGGSTFLGQDGDFSNCATGAVSNVVVDSSSKAFIRSADLSGSSAKGLVVFGGSEVNADSCDISNSAARGVDVEASTVSLSSASINNSGERALNANHMSQVNAEGSSCLSSADPISVLSSNGSIINFKDGVSTSSSAEPVRVFSGANINATGSTGSLNQAVNVLTSNGVIYKNV